LKQLYSNATVYWSEYDLVRREAIIKRLFSIIKDAWLKLNKAVRFHQIETPIITPDSYLTGHTDSGFPMLSTSRGLLRPETTAGAISVLMDMYPMANNRTKNLPLCLWQHGKSFREEDKPDTMRATKLRLVEFNQLEFELFASSNTKAKYIEKALNKIVESFGVGEVIEADTLPHYSRKTLDWEIDGLEVAGCSERTDWPDGVIYEMSFGLDRLVAVMK